MADFQVVTHVPQTSTHPGGCSLCQVDQRQDPLTGELELMVRTHVQTDLTAAEGDLDRIRFLADNKIGNEPVFCKSCVLEMAVLFGAQTSEQAEALAAEIDALNGFLQDLEEQLHAAQIANQALLQDRHTAAFGPVKVTETPLPFPEKAAASK